MSNKNERQLLITAYSKKGKNASEFGGLPYSIPIVNPIWVGMDKIIAAKAMGVLDIYVHNVEPAVLLTDELYNKFYELGYIDEDVVKLAEEEATNNLPDEEEVEEIVHEEELKEEETSEEVKEEEAEGSEKPKASKKGKKGKE